MKKIIAIIVLISSLFVLSSFFVCEKKEEIKPKIVTHTWKLPKGYKFSSYRFNRADFTYQLEPMEEDYQPRTIKIFQRINSGHDRNYSYSIIFEYNLVECR